MPIFNDLYRDLFQTPVQIKEFGAVNKIDFSPAPPYNYAVTASSRVSGLSEASPLSFLGWSRTGKKKA